MTGSIDVDEMPWILAARRVLTAAARGDRAVATLGLQGIHDEFGPRVLPDVMLAWIDTVITTTLPKRPPGDPVVELGFQAEGQSSLSDVADVSPSVVWAGRLLAARRADDEAMFEALLTAYPDTREYSENVLTLLLACGTTLRAAGWPQ